MKKSILKNVFVLCGLLVSIQAGANEKSEDSSETQKASQNSQQTQTINDDPVAYSCEPYPECFLWPDIQKLQAAERNKKEPETTE
ncbi:MAG: hypothetical protein OQK04_11465 [Kangiellaceae bacterium]|nr:hypothetical protein [Kangiellaceae bacterium]MCW8999321.1 hypothetical protein [Kangiellaceae bacterium]